MKPPRRYRGKTDFVKRAGALTEMYLMRATMRAIVCHDWKDSKGMRWVVVNFSGRPYLAYEEDI